MLATIKKEFLLLMRDPSGLLLLLLMPAVLIIVMAFVQDAPYKSYQQMLIEMPVVNNDKGNLGEKIIADLQKNKSFKIIEKKNGEIYNTEMLQEDIRNGDYSLGVIIPENTTRVLVNKSNKLSNALAQGMGMPASLPEAEGNDSAIVHLIFDPVTQATFRTSVGFALNQYVAQTQMQILVERLATSSGDTMLSSSLLDESLQAIHVKEERIGDSKQMMATLNSVQHNVPAWAIFGMFLIVVPIAGNMIREREEGSWLRLQLIPGTRRSVALGKILFYIILCFIQFIVMMLIGILLLPAIGLPALYLGKHPEALIPMALAIAFTATSYGLFIGTAFKTANQAMSIGAISVVLVSAIGGLWVPIDILPKFMQKLALISPLHWSLEGLNTIMLRGEGMSGILLPLGVMIAIGILFTILSIIARKKYIV